MFCSECGKQARGKFCSHCGARLDADGGAGHGDDAGGDDSQELLRGDWSQVVDYDQLLRYAEVRERIALAAAEATAGLTGEQFVEACEKALKPLGLAPVPLAAIVKFAQPLHAKLGVKTGKRREQLFDLPPGVVLTGVLCSLARHGQQVKATQSHPDGSTITAELPSDVFALAGTMTVTVRRSGAGTAVEASTHIPGQMFDWGKSQRRLEQLLSETARAA